MRETLQIATSQSGTHSFSARDLATVLFRHKKLFAVSFLVVLTLGVVYSMAAKS
jgi:uncharacterized protein involved in exopolysaccharide biosynthesis